MYIDRTRYRPCRHLGKRSTAVPFGLRWLSLSRARLCGLSARQLGRGYRSIQRIEISSTNAPLTCALLPYTSQCTRLWNALANYTVVARLVEVPEGGARAHE